MQKIERKVIIIMIVLISIISTNFNKVYAVNSTTNSNLNVTSTNKEDKKNTDNDSKTTQSSTNLKMLGINPNDFKGFKPDITTYDVIVPNNVSKVNVYATPEDSKSKVSGIGNQKLEVGENELNVVVTSESGDKKTYTINVTRKDVNGKVITSTSKNATKKDDLKNLQVEGYNLSPTFSSDVYEYTLELTDNVSELNINAEGANSYIDVEIIGNKDLADGENTITIIATNTSTKRITTYQIKVIKNVNKAAVSPDILKKALIIRYILIGLMVGFIFISIIFIVVNVKNAKVNNYEDYYDEDEDELPKSLRKDLGEKNKRRGKH